MMKSIFMLLMISFNASALVEKSKEVVAHPEIKIENTKEKSMLKQLEIGTELTLNHREPFLFPDGRVIEVNYFSHKAALRDGPRRASVGLKLTGSKDEIVVLHHDQNSAGKESFSTQETGDYSIKLVQMFYDDKIIIVINPK